MLLSQLEALRGAPIDPLQRQQAVQAERERSYQELLSRAHGPKRWLLQRLYRALVCLGGYREAHKYFLVMVLWQIQRRVLAEAARLVETGRLDSAEQAFDLTLDQLSRALSDSSLDLRGLACENRAFPDRLAAVPALPQVFDSRGRIHRPKPGPRKPGELSGVAISPGVARGPVKVLHSPDEKPLLAGDVLVARATDPGWTPLFASASAVVLEVGGMLQHGALVAREYGLPCVAGVVDVTSALQDGQMVEVDGTSGVVRLLEPPPVSG
jgi:pyruvate,water dikinase